jgi:lantibiotic modifying enzyme
LQKQRQSDRKIESELITVLNDLSERYEPIRIMRHLLLTSIPSEGSLCWLGPIMGPDLKDLSFGLIDDTAAVGASGIGLFFAICCSSFPELKIHTEDLTISALRNFLTFFNEADEQRLRKWWIDSPAGLWGTGGAMLLFSILDSLEIQPIDTRWRSFVELQDEIISCIEFEDLLTQPYDDVTAGLAGLIPPLYKQGSAKAVEISLAIGHELLKRQNANGTWNNNNISRSGFAHGNAGIAAVLAFLWGQTGEAEFAAACHRAIVAENKLKNIEHEGWRDLRYEADKNVYTQLWCQGSTGIAMSRLIMLENSCCQDEAISDLRLAIMAMLHASDHGIDDLCCGLSGITSVLNILADDDHIGWLKQTGWSADSVKEKAKELQSTMVMGAKPRGHYRTFIANGTTELLSLMTGLAGIGLSQLDSRPAKMVLRSWLSCGMLPTRPK